MNFKYMYPAIHFQMFKKEFQMIHLINMNNVTNILVIK